MKKILFLFFAVLLSLNSSKSFAQTRQVKEVKITSSAGWNGEENYSELLIKNEKGIYSLNGNKVEKKFVDDLLKAIGETKINYPQMENLGVTKKWLNENFSQDFNGYLTERLGDALPTQKTLYFKSLKNPEVIKQTFSGLFFFTASDYYPEMSVEITEKNGSKTKIFSDSQTMLSLPWQVKKNGRKITTFNAHISHAISNLMPEKSANKRRLIGEDLREELAKAVMDEIEDKWNLLEVEEKTPKELKELRKSFEVQTAFIYEKEGDGFFSAILRRKDFPKNFSILLELPYEKGAIKNIDVFNEKIESYKNLVFSVNWLKNYIFVHPEEEFRLNFDTDSSFGASLENEFYEQINSTNKKKLVDEVKINQEKISAIQVGGKYFFSEWLILPNKKMILFRYNYFDSLMKWKVKNFNSFDCDNRKCVGAIISASGNILSTLCATKKLVFQKAKSL